MVEADLQARQAALPHCKECRETGAYTLRTADKKRRQQPAHEASEPTAKRRGQSGATSGEQASARSTEAAPVTVNTEVAELEVEVEAEAGVEVVVKMEEAKELELVAEVGVEAVKKMEEAEELEVEAEPEVRVKVATEDLVEAEPEVPVKVGGSRRFRTQLVACERE